MALYLGYKKYLCFAFQLKLEMSVLRGKCIRIVFLSYVPDVLRDI